MSVAREELQPGDLVFFNTMRAQFSHVGIYIGENRFIHAPSRGKSVEIVDITNSYWQKRYNGARRLPL
jgi:cell wall-associated NlpC family hydrolase